MFISNNPRTKAFNNKLTKDKVYSNVPHKADYMAAFNTGSRVRPGLLTFIFEKKKPVL
jgi:hypothetical protein